VLDKEGAVLTASTAYQIMNSFLKDLFSLMSIFFLFIGIKVVFSKRPVFMSSRYFFAFMVLAFSPQFVSTVTMFTKDMPDKLGFILLLNPIMFICLLVFFWFQMKGYMAIGVSDDSFRDALHYSLKKNSLPFEEQLSVIKLTSINANLQIAIQSWMGSGQLKLKKSNDKTILPNIIAGINEFYIENSIKPNNITSIFYIIMGVFMLIFSVAFFFVFP
jgi:hypothetical protein